MPTASTIPNTRDAGANPVGLAEVVIHMEPPHGATSVTHSPNTAPITDRTLCAEREPADARSAFLVNSAGAGSAASAGLFWEKRP